MDSNDRAAIEAITNVIDNGEWFLTSTAIATAALAALRDAGFWVERWRPIGDAPKDGLIDIIIDSKTRWTNCYYDQICDQWRTIGHSGHLAWVPARAVAGPAMCRDGDRIYRCRSHYETIV